MAHYHPPHKDFATQAQKLSLLQHSWMRGGGGRIVFSINSKKKGQIIHRLFRNYNLPCHLKSIQDTSNTNPARIVMGMTESTPQVTVCMTFEFQDQYLDNDARITFKKKEISYVQNFLVIKNGKTC